MGVTAVTLILGLLAGQLGLGSGGEEAAGREGRGMLMRLLLVQELAQRQAQEAGVSVGVRRQGRPRLPVLPVGGERWQYEILGHLEVALVALGAVVLEGVAAVGRGAAAARVLVLLQHAFQAAFWAGGGEGQLGGAGGLAPGGVSS
ncbi:hypothetical protein AAFF_G00391250 [Aldrovandia affinis]|uniref:Secreted protein n=1 Tax=Aldrovandia affinis TaxID=143900 RepID=A0AAD7SDU1_9TELE|nr:hypothetical protein AAFF_G00391250 [Aldrovandia affinis]